MDPGRLGDGEATAGWPTALDGAEMRQRDGRAPERDLGEQGERGACRRTSEVVWDALEQRRGAGGDLVADRDGGRRAASAGPSATNLRARTSNLDATSGESGQERWRNGLVAAVRAQTRPVWSHSYLRLSHNPLGLHTVEEIRRLTPPSEVAD